MVTKRLLATAATLLLTAGGAAAGTSELTCKEAVGKKIFFDQRLSVNKNQACAACHAPEVGWTGPDQEINKHGAVYEGSVMGQFGNRKPPSSAYATTSPFFRLVNVSDAAFAGGNFWDGRATGAKLGNPAADQAQGPFLNPKEQALPDAACVVYRVCNSDYGMLFQQVWPGACDIDWPTTIDFESACSNPSQGPFSLDAMTRAKVDVAYNDVAYSIAAYEDSKEVNAFSSKYDAHLNGKADLSDKEKWGLRLFNGKGKCANCHISTVEQKCAGGNDCVSSRCPDPVDRDRISCGKGYPLFTDYTFDNLGVPKNPENPFYGQPEGGPNWIDPGLKGFLSTRMDFAMYADKNFGKHKVPTLRNVDKRPYPMFVKDYGHNGYFKSLKEIVHFYNTRDKFPTCNPGDPGEKMTCWPAPEVSDNVNKTELGNLGLSDMEEDAIVAFMKTLSDGYRQYNQDSQ
ncbi:cytochrome C [Geobacter hydrogenophilus]|uniref:Cytochrome c n=1 Tax=Geobacter hydrogenophilus TaxID=40983 RepID=A0A9W6FXG1_9BACT|nr:cytochrome c peroxidase [Geobacter hydrogenophilus]MBT0894811.1 cytochrome C [Geobacter hydrogenophilus]GLI36784.1 cytochrome c [Geobacter hydrogenophilus]